MERTCPACGHPVEEGHLFCTSCGASLREQPGAGGMPEPVTQPERQSTSTSESEPVAEPQPSQGPVSQPAPVYEPMPEPTAPLSEEERTRRISIAVISVLMAMALLLLLLPLIT